VDLGGFSRPTRSDWEKSERLFDIRRIGGSGDGARRYRERADSLVPGERSTRDQQSRLGTIAEGYPLTEKAVGAANLKLTDAEATKFWPVYDDIRRT